MNMTFAEITGEVITRDSKKYEDARLSWNRAIDVHPLIIIYCYKEKDVINAIKFAKKNSFEFRIRSGGHSYEGYSTGENLLVIDVSNLKEINIDEDKKIVKLGGELGIEKLMKLWGLRDTLFQEEAVQLLELQD